MKRVVLLMALLMPVSLAAQQLFTRTVKLMGSRFDITVQANDSIQGNSYIDLAIGEIKRIEKLISSWDPASQTSEINRNAGIQPVKVDEELFGLIQRSLGLSRLTDGAFDITYASMDRIWQFDGTMSAMPDQIAIRTSVEKVGYAKLRLDPEKKTVFLSEAGMKIGFGGIGKGYAADQAKALLVKNGVQAGIINASGDMNTWGSPPDSDSWRIAITNPVRKNNVFAMLPLQEGAVVTSGDYERYVTFNGIRYAHIINPKTGYPATGIVSVTVLAPKAELADALATSVFVMGTEVGLNRINQLPGVECVIIDEDGQVFTSDHIKLERQ